MSANPYAPPQTAAPMAFDADCTWYATELTALPYGELWQATRSVYFFVLLGFRRLVRWPTPPLFAFTVGQRLHLTVDQLPLAAQTAMRPVVEEAAELGFRVVRLREAAFIGGVQIYVAGLVSADGRTYLTLLYRTVQVGSLRRTYVEYVLQSFLLDDRSLITANRLPGIAEPPNVVWNSLPRGKMRAVFELHQTRLAASDVPSHDLNAEETLTQLLEQRERELVKFHTERGYYYVLPSDEVRRLTAGLPDQKFSPHLLVLELCAWMLLLLSVVGLCGSVGMNPWLGGLLFALPLGASLGMLLRIYRGRIASWMK